MRNMTDKQALRNLSAAVRSVDDKREHRPQDPEILKLLAKGEQEIAAGIGHSLDEVLADSDDLYEPIIL